MKYLHKVNLVIIYVGINPSIIVKIAHYPGDVEDQSVKNVLAHWIPKLIIDSMYELVR